MTQPLTIASSDRRETHNRKDASGRLGDECHIQHDLLAFERRQTAEPDNNLIRLHLDALPDKARPTREWVDGHAGESWHAQIDIGKRQRLALCERLVDRSLDQNAASGNVDVDKSVGAVGTRSAGEGRGSKLL
jgi:hypothetical protein